MPRQDIHSQGDQSLSDASRWSSCSHKANYSYPSASPSAVGAGKVGRTRPGTSKQHEATAVARIYIPCRRYLEVNPGMPSCSCGLTCVRTLVVIALVPEQLEGGSHSRPASAGALYLCLSKSTLGLTEVTTDQVKGI
jgi:hypothetical protein